MTWATSWRMVHGGQAGTGSRAPTTAAISASCWVESTIQSVSSASLSWRYGLIEAPSIRSCFDHDTPQAIYCECLSQMLASMLPDPP